MSKNFYYVYVYLDPRKKGRYEYENVNCCFLYEPFYVGKGKSDRYKMHLYPYSLKYSNLKNNKIKAIKKSGHTPFCEMYLTGITENNALINEAILIKSIGKIINNTGVLANISEEGVKSNMILSMRKIDKICMKTKEVIVSYESIVEAGLQNNIDMSNIVACCRHKAITAGGFYWKYHDEELQINDIQKKKIIQYDYNYNIIKVYNSITEAAKNTNSNYVLISKCCRGLQGETNGFIWEYSNISIKEKKEYRKKRESINSNSEKYVKKICKITNKETIYKSLILAAIDNDVSDGYINMMCKGKRGKLNSYKFYYLNDRSYDDIIDKHHNEPYKKKKAVIQLDLDKNIISEWVSANEASDKLHIDRRSICSCCIGKRITSGGFKWMYK
jgi:hypothetical protein